MAATDRTLRLEQELADQIRRISDADVKVLVAAWARAWDEVAADLTEVLAEMLVAGQNVTAAQMRRSSRLQKALQLALTRLAALSVLVDRTTLASLQRVIDVTGGAQASIIDSQLPPAAPQLVDLEAWSKVDPGQVDAIVARSTQQITSGTRPLAAHAYAVMRRELVRGVVVGSNPRETARRMLQRAEGGFNGGLGRAMTIARTETLDAHRAAAQLAQAQHADVLAGWQWVATLGSRTCRACWGMNGQVFGLDEPGPLGHQNCRCSRVPVTKTWRQLGINQDEPRSLLPDTGAVFAALSKAEQVRVLGPSGWAAWNAGKFPPEAWAARRTTKGWRDSYVPAKPPTQAGGGIIVPPPPRTPGAVGGPDSPDPGRVTRAKGVTLEAHERVTAHRVASLGHDVHWLPNPQGRKSPDVVVLDRIWETKAPKGQARRTVSDILRRADDQAQRVILDLYRTELRHDLEEVRRQIALYWHNRAGDPHGLAEVWVLTDNVRDHFTLERPR